MKQSEINKLTKEGYIQVDKTTRKQIDEILEIGKEISAKIVSPQKIDKEIKWFSQYAEIEILLEDPDRVFDIILDYMVSSVEIIAPKEFTINTQTHQDRLNDLIIKMRESEKFILGLAAQKKVLEAEIQNQKTKQQ
ncbi:MAG: hypothetical protein CXT77_05335 [uncultured DHVE6 group euryarchaeote]|nr:MAG: hypothetical protein CXT77_05335 [uncultured DHVE6 group euryarchaeote]